MIRKTLMASAACLTLAAAPALADDPEAAKPPVARVDVHRDADVWTVRYTFNRNAPAWLFTRSALALDTEAPWRPLQFSVVTPGVRLERRGFHDVLVAESGDVPEVVDIALTPASVNLMADYDPALVFSDGAVALYSAHFEVLPLDAAIKADTLASDFSDAGLDAGPTEVAMTDDAGPVLAHGERWDGVVLTQDQSYVLFGAGEAVETEAVASLIDPGLPVWLREALDQNTPRTLAYYQERLGPKAGERPTVMVAWRGPTPGLSSMGGSVLPGMVVMTFEGQAMAAPDRGILNTALWFIAHESAHFWLGQTVHQARTRDSWFTEGGADLMAIRASEAIDPEYDGGKALQSATDDCVAMAGKPLAEAGDRNQHRARYACGALFHLAAESATRRVNPEADVFTVLKTLIDAHREADPAIDLEDWLAWFTPIAGADAADIVRRIVEDGSPDPVADLTRLFDLTGVATTSVEGRLMLADA